MSNAFRPYWVGRRDGALGLVVRLSAVASLLGGLVVGLEASPAAAATPSVFASVNQPIGMATTLGGVLVTQLKRDKVLLVNSSGVSSTFATLPSTGNADLDRYIAVSSGLGGFPSGYIYVTVRQDILQITPDGKTVTTFATIPDLPSSNNSINFDTLGNFGNDMLVAGGNRATLYRVKSDGSWSLVADLSGVAGELEDPEVAPADFIPYAGDVIATSKLDSTVYAIEADGSFSVVGTMDGADEVAFIPSTVCDFGTSGGAYFAALTDQNQILKFPSTDFTGLTGALISSETITDIDRFSSNGSSIDISQFSGPIGTGQLEGSAFAPCPSPPTITSFTPASGPVGTSVTINGTGFTGTTSVKFNGVAASYTVNSDIQITAVVPAGATTGKITVTNAGGTATSSTNFTVTTATSTCTPAWRLATTPTNANQDTLQGTAAISDTDVWAVGFQKVGSVNQTLTEHLIGTIWSIVTSPNTGTQSQLAAVSGSSASDVWAVGNSLNGSLRNTLAMHWDGAAWVIVTTPNGAGTINYLTGVKALASNDVWAVGYYRSGTVNKTLALHYNGTTWTVVTTPSPGSSAQLNAVSGTSSTDLWAVGTTDGQALALHYNGTAWTQVATPSAGTLLGVAAASATNAWAVGSNSNNTLAMHYDGTAWTTSTTVNPGTVNSLNSVSSVNGNDIWAAGSFTSGGVQRSLIEHWDGTAWSQASSPAQGNLLGAAARSGGLVWSAGAYPSSSTGLSLVQQLCEAQVTEAGFSPSKPTMALGDTVAWTFPTTNTQSHSVTDLSGLGLFDSGLRGPGSSFTYTVTSGGGYKIKDNASSFTSTVDVPDTVSPLSGDMGTTFTVTWATVPAVSPYVYDLQIKRPGSTRWENWLGAQTATSTTFLPDAGPGTYQWHSRYRNTTTNSSLLFSLQPVSITVTQPQPAPTITGFTPDVGSPGTVVTITGTTFTNANSVKFNGFPATTFTVDSDTKISATVPTGGTTGPISVTTPGGTATSSSSFTVLIGVSMGEFFFTPTPLTVGQGATVLYTNNGSLVHDTNSDGCVDGTSFTGVGLWCSPDLDPGQQYQFLYYAAGQFPYHCSFHPTQMTGTISIQPTASPPSGPVGTTFTITVATQAPDSDLVYDIQKKDPGRQFQDWQIGVTTPSVTFVPSSAGTYQFRSRVRRVSTGQASSYSLQVSITVS